MSKVNPFLTNFSYEGKPSLFKAVDEINSSIYALFGGRKVYLMNSEWIIDDYSNKNKCSQGIVFLFSLPLFIITCPLKILSLGLPESIDHIKGLKERIGTDKVKNLGAQNIGRLAKGIFAALPKEIVEKFSKEPEATRELKANKKIGDYRLIDVPGKKFTCLILNYDGSILRTEIGKKEDIKREIDLFKIRKIKYEIRDLINQNKIVLDEIEAKKELVKSKKPGDFRVFRDLIYWKLIVIDAKKELLPAVTVYDWENLKEVIKKETEEAKLPIRKFKNQTEYDQAVKKLKVGEYFLKNSLLRMNHYELIQKFPLGGISSSFLSDRFSNTWLEIQMERILGENQKNIDFLEKILENNKCTFKHGTFPCEFVGENGMQPFIEKQKKIGAFYLRAIKNVNTHFVIGIVTRQGIKEEQISYSENLPEKMELFHKRYNSIVSTADVQFESFKTKGKTNLRKEDAIAFLRIQTLSGDASIGEYRFWREPNGNFGMAFIDFDKKVKYMVISKEGDLNKEVLKMLDELRTKVNGRQRTNPGNPFSNWGDHFANQSNPYGGFTNRGNPFFFNWGGHFANQSNPNGGGRTNRGNPFFSSWGDFFANRSDPIFNNEPTKPADIILDLKKKFLEKNNKYLGNLKANCTFVEIYKAVRKAGVKFHPDKNPDSLSQIQALYNDWDLLKKEITKHFDIKGGIEENFQELDNFLKT